LKVVGVGYGRTGTYSLTLALEELGLPTLHTSHLFEHVEHEEVVAMWLKEVFQPSIEKRNATLGSLDLNTITGHGYRATCDLPMALYYEQVLREYPDCKFILTTRTDSEEWFRSWNTLAKSIEKSASFGNVFSAVKPFLIYIRWLFARVNENNSYLTSHYPLPEQNKEACIASYEAHNRRVREVIPKRQLLEYNVKQGWEPLCNFLEIENCPNTPFPKSNSARFVKVQALSSFLFPSLIGVILCAFCLKIFRGGTGKTVLRWANRKSKRGLENHAWTES